MRNFIIVLFLALFIFSLPSGIAPVSSNPNVQTNNNGIVIVYDPMYYLAQNMSHRFHVHIFNYTDTIPLNNSHAKCFYHLYNNSGYDADYGNMEFETYNGYDFAITISGKNFTELGYYDIIIQCEMLANYKISGYAKSSHEVTPKGLEKIGDNALLFYWIGFIILSASLVFLFLYSLGHFIKLDTDLIDVAYSWGAYFALLAYNGLQTTYLGNTMINNISSISIKVGAFTALALPFLSFIVSMITQTLVQKKIKEGRL